MTAIQVQIGKNTIEDVLLDGGSGVNIITKQLRFRLGLPKPKPAPYNLRMADQTTTKPVGLIRALKIYVLPWESNQVPKQIPPRACVSSSDQECCVSNSRIPFSES